MGLLSFLFGNKTAKNSLFDMFKPKSPSGTNTIWQHIRRGGKDSVCRKIGILVAFKSNNGTIKIGYSKYNRKMETVPFDTNLGLREAIKRAVEHPVMREIPVSIHEDMRIFTKRASRYFKRQLELNESMSGSCATNCECKPPVCEV